MPKRGLVRIISILIFLFSKFAIADVGFEFETDVVATGRAKSCPEGLCVKRLKRKDTVFSKTNYSIEADDSLLGDLLALQKRTPKEETVKKIRAVKSSMEVVAPVDFGFPVTEEGYAALNGVLSEVDQIFNYIWEQRHESFIDAHKLVGLVPAGGTPTQDRGIFVDPSKVETFGKDGPTGTLQATVGVPLRRLPKLIKDLEHLCPKGKLGVEKLNTYLTKAGSSSLLDWEICRMLQHRMNPDRIEELKEELIGVVALVSSYIYGAKIATVFLKDRLPLVAKTDLGTILGLVKKEFSADFLKQLIEQTYYETNIASYGDMFTNYQHLYRGVLTARRDVWLAGAISGRDTLQERYSPKMEIPSVDQVIVPLESIGALGDKMDSVNGKPAPIFEIRCLGSFDHRADWMKKAREVFQYVQGLNTPLPKEVKDGLVPK